MLIQPRSNRFIKFHNLLRSQFGENKSFICFTFKSSHIDSDNIIQLINLNNLSDKNLLVDSFLWAILHSDLKLLIFSCQKLIELDKKLNTSLKKRDKDSLEIPNINSAILNQGLSFSNILLNPDRLNRYINYTDEPFIINPRQKYRGCILASLPLYLLTFNNYNRRVMESKNFLKINLSNHNVSDQQQHFEKIQALPGSIFHSTEYCITSADNFVFIYNSSSNITCYDPNSISQNKIVSINQEGTPQISPPFTSDGHFIYSIGYKEIGVYCIVKSSNKLILKFLKTIPLSFDKNKLMNPFNNLLIPTEFLEGASFVTNGIVLEIIYPISSEITKITHFARVISLITGNHIHDFHFDLPYPIHSISLEPITRNLWVLSAHNNGVCFKKIKYTGPDPLWLSNLQITSIFPNPKKCTTVSLFKNFAIDYCHSLFSQFYGSEFQEDEFMTNFFSSELDASAIDLIFSILKENEETVELKFIQLMFILLSFYLQNYKVDYDHQKSLYLILKDYISIPELTNFLILFIIHIANNIKTGLISSFFGLILNHHDSFELTLLLNMFLQLEDSKKFPFIIDNNCPNVINKILLRLRNDKIYNETEKNFIMTYLSSIFSNYSRILQKNPTKIKLIEMVIFSFTQHIIENSVMMLSDLQSIQKFTNSSFILILKKLLILLKLAIHSPSFVWPLLPNLLELMKSFPSKRFFEINSNNPFYLFFMDIFFLYVYSFKQMFSFSDIQFLQKYSQFLNIKINDKEKTVSDIFENKLSDDDLATVIDTIYSKVANPLNKRLTPEEKNVEKFLFLSLFDKTHTIQEIIEFNDKIKSKEPIKILPIIRQIAQAVYGIRSNLRLKRQNEDQSEYLRLHKNVVDKSHFLLTFSSEKSDVKSISSFINSNIQIAEIILAQNKLESVIQSFSFFALYTNSFIRQKIPDNVIYMFIMYICDNSNIFESYEFIKNFMTNKVDLKPFESIISILLDKINSIPPNPILAFLLNLIIILSKSFEEKEIHGFIYESIKKIIERFCAESNKIDRFVFKSCIALICQFHRILNEEKYFLIKEDEIQSILGIFNDNLDLKYSMSSTLEHSFIQGLFYKPKPINLMKSLVGYTGQPKFHSISLLLYDTLRIFSEKNQENEFLSFVASIFDIIGTILSGANSDQLLKIASPISELNNAPDFAYCRTPTSQLACILELIQVIRKLMINKESNSSRLLNFFIKKISDNIQLNDQTQVKQIFAMFAILSNIIEIKRPYTIVTNKENKSYFITSFDEKANKIKGLLLPLTSQQVIEHSFENSNDLKSFEIIPYKYSMLADLDISHSIFEMATNIEMKQYSDCLYTFYALQCVKENILDTDNGANFSNQFFNEMKNTTINYFIFRDNVSLILSLLKKSLTVPNEGIFVGSPVKPQFYHASYTQLEFKDDFTLTENVIESHSTPHVFISSIIDDAHIVYFQLKYNSVDQQYDFGVITHSVDQNQSISITFSTIKLGFCINGEKVADYYLDIDNRKPELLMECRYHPLKNKVSFADSRRHSRIFSCRFPTKYQCSFIVLVHPGTKLDYNCSFDAATDCFQKNIHFRQIAHPTKFFKKVKRKLFDKKETIDEGQTKFSMMIEHERDEENNDIVVYSKNINEIRSDIVDFGLQNDPTNKGYIDSFANFDDLRETALLLASYSESSFNSILKNIYSSPIRLNQYAQIHDLSGQFDLIPDDHALIEIENSIPPFHFLKYHHLPVEVLNCYFSGF